MKEGLVTITLNQQAYTFNIEKDLSGPSLQCGVPACGKEYFLFAGTGAEKPAIGFDGGLFGHICEDLVSQAIKKNSYSDLPVFIRQFNECTGWNTFLDDEVKVDGAGLLKALDHLSKASLSGWLMKDRENYCKALSDFTRTQMKKGRELFLLKM